MGDDTVEATTFSHSLAFPNIAHDAPLPQVCIWKWKDDKEQGVDSAGVDVEDGAERRALMQAETLVATDRLSAFPRSVGQPANITNADYWQVVQST